MWEGCPEKGAVNVHLVLAPWKIQVLAFGAEDLHRTHRVQVAGPRSQAGLAVAEHSRAAAKLNALVLFQHGGQAAHGEDKSRVDQAIQLLSRALHNLMLLL